MITLGIPSRTVARKKAVEKYDFPVLTTTAVAGKKAGRNISFNKAALKALGLDVMALKKDVPSLVTFGSGPEGAVYIGNVSEVPGANGLKVGKSTNRLQDKPSYDFLLKVKGLTEDVDNEFRLIDSGEVVEGVVLFAIEPLTVADLDTAKTIDTVIEQEFEEAANEDEAISLGSDFTTEEETPFEETPLTESAEEEDDMDSDFDFDM